MEIPINGEALGMSSLGLWWFGQPHRGCNRGVVEYRSEVSGQQRLIMADKERSTKKIEYSLLYYNTTYIYRYTVDIDIIYVHMYVCIRYTDLNVPTGFYPFSRMVAKWLDPHLSRISLHNGKQFNTSLCKSWNCHRNAGAAQLQHFAPVGHVEKVPPSIYTQRWRKTLADHHGCGSIGTYARGAYPYCDDMINHSEPQWC